MGKWSTFYAARTYVETDLFTYFWLTVSPNVKKLPFGLYKQAPLFSIRHPIKMVRWTTESKYLDLLSRWNRRYDFCWRCVKLFAFVAEDRVFECDSVDSINQIDSTESEANKVRNSIKIRPTKIYCHRSNDEKRCFIPHGVRHKSEWQLAKGNVNNSSDAFFLCRSLWQFFERKYLFMGGPWLLVLHRHWLSHNFYLRWMFVIHRATIWHGDDCCHCCWGIHIGANQMKRNCRQLEAIDEWKM